jgi:DNA-binding NarL/FixJ family response regulator
MDGDEQAQRSTLEIFFLLTQGLRNAEIADQLSTTPRTAAHHVSDILAKLQVRSRTDAVRLARAAIRRAAEFDLL